LVRGGSVGIGTTNPFAMLHVNGTPDIDYGNQTLFDNRSAAINYGGVISFAGYKTSTSAANVWAQIKGANELGTGAENGYLAFITNTPVESPTIYQVISLVTNGGGVVRTRHLRVRMNLCREALQMGRIKIAYVPTLQMIADGLTKALEGRAFLEFMLNLFGFAKIEE
jgi:hypothetical protein